jgi:hypothetical protein
LYLSAVKYWTWVVRHTVSGGVQFNPFSVLSIARDSCHKSETVTGWDSLWWGDLLWFSSRWGDTRDKLTLLGVVKYRIWWRRILHPFPHLGVIRQDSD